MSRATSALISFIAISAVGGVLLAGLAIPAVGAAGAVANSSAEFFDELPVELNQEPMSQQSRILWSDGSIMATFFYENRVSVPLSSVAPVMQKAVIASEDRRFYEHRGADPKGILRAIITNITGARGTQGASTLTQQWVKNVLLSQALENEDKDAVRKLQTDDEGRKLREIKLALAAEQRLSKAEILQNYLNIALFGDGAYGVESASRHWFGHSAAELTLPEAALLTGILPSPTKYNPIKNPEGAMNRRDIVLELMLDAGFITQQEHDEALMVTLEQTLNVTRTQNGCEAAGSAAFFCDYVTKVILNDPTFGATKQDRQKLLYRGGLNITSTLNHRLQDLAAKALNDRISQAKSGDVASSIVSVQPSTGHIVAMAQNREYKPRKDADSSGTSINYNTDFEYGGSQGFQAGSTFKPIALTQWLKDGHSLQESVNSNVRTYNMGSDFSTKCGYGLGGPYKPSNAEGKGSGYMSVLNSTTKSVNNSYIDMATQMDLCDVRDTAQSLGITLAKPEEPASAGREANQLHPVPSMVLGSNNVSPLSMAGAFSAFGNQGVFCKPTAFTKVEAGGKPFAIQADSCNRVMEEQVANGVNFALQTILQPGGTASGKGIGRPAAGKTGTTNSSRNVWFVGFTPDLATAVWVGHEGGERSLNYSVINGRRIGRAYGGGIAAPVWQQYMKPAHNGMPVRGFQDPSKTVTIGNTQPLPDVRGMSAAQAKGVLESKGYRVTVSRSTVKSSHRRGTVANTSPYPGARVSPNARVVLRLSDGSVQAEPKPHPKPDNPAIPAPPVPAPLPGPIEPPPGAQTFTPVPGNNPARPAADRGQAQPAIQERQQQDENDVPQRRQDPVDGD